MRSFRCLGLAYLRWAIRNPTHFRGDLQRRLFDHDKSANVSRNNAELIELTERTLSEAFAAGQLRSADLKTIQTRALVYGFARMNIDGHFPRWGGGRRRRRADRGAGSRSFHRGHRQADIKTVVIPGRCDASNPESRDSGFASRPGMTAIRSGCARPKTSAPNLPCDVGRTANSLRVHDDYTTFL